jgi:AP2 domain
VQVSQAYKSPAGLVVATIEVPISQGYFTRIYEADQVVTDGRKLYAVPHRNTVYVRTKVNGKNVYLHKLLEPDWKFVDHSDGDGLNNCRDNLRNGAGFRNRVNTRLRSDNSSGFKGVYRDGHRWRATITPENMKSIHLGMFDSPEEAAYAYDQAAVSFFGEYARTNAMLGMVTTKGAGPRHRDGEHCAAGHKYTPENTYVDPTGKRECKTCRRERTRVPSPQPRGSKPCPPGCTCRRHVSRPGRSEPCPSGCTCGRHRRAA